MELPSSISLPISLWLLGREILWSNFNLTSVRSRYGDSEVRGAYDRYMQRSDKRS